MDHRAQFDDFTLRIARNDVGGYHALMRGTMKDYLRAAMAYLSDIVYQHKANKVAKKNTEKWQRKS